MKEKSNYIAFFDLDDTLLNVNSGKILARQAYKNNLMDTKEIIKAIYLAFLHHFNLKPTEILIDTMPGWLKGLPEKTMEDFCQQIFSTHLLHCIRPKMYDEIKFHKERNAHLVILSATINYVCTPIAKHLQFDDIICSRMIVSSGKFSGEADGALCFGNEKLIRVRDYCKSYKRSLTDAFYYADSIDDLDVLQIVGHPVCINPDKKLSKIAKGKSWPVYHW